MPNRDRLEGQPPVVEELPFYRRPLGRADLSAGWQWVLIFWCCYILFVGYHGVTSDGDYRFKALRKWLSTGEVSDVKFSLIGPLVSSPLIVGVADEHAARQRMQYFNWGVLLAGLAALWFIVRTHIPNPVFRRFALFVLLGSMYPHHQKHYFAEVFSSLTLAVATCLFIIRPQQNSAAIAGIALCALSGANTPATIPGLMLATFYLAWATRRSAPIVAPLAAMALFLLENKIRRGDWWLTGYDEREHGIVTMMPYSGRPGFNHPFFIGVLCILFSFGRGIVWYAPGILAPVLRPRPVVNLVVQRLTRCWALYIVGLVLVYAKWWAWAGGGFWGPRFFLFASLLSSLYLAERLGSTAKSDAIELVYLSLAVTLSMWVGMVGYYCEYVVPYPLSEHGWEFEAFQWHVPEFSDLWHPIFIEGEFTRTPSLFIFPAFIIVWMTLMAPVIVEIGRRLKTLVKRRHVDREAD